MMVVIPSPLALKIGILSLLIAMFAVELWGYLSANLRLLRHQLIIER